MTLLTEQLTSLIAQHGPAELLSVLRRIIYQRGRHLVATGKPELGEWQYRIADAMHAASLRMDYALANLRAGGR